MASVGPQQADRRLNRTAVALAGLLAATLAFGLTSRALGHELGTPLPPLMLTFEPRLDPLAAAGVAALAAGVVVAGRLARAALRPAGFAAAVGALALAMRLALNACRGGTGEWSRVFAVATPGEGRHEYLPALGGLNGGAGPFLDHFAGLVPDLPTHASSHPPGLLLVLHALGIGSAGGMAALTIGVGALAAPLLYLIGRDLFDEGCGRVAALLFVFAPSALLYGATSADALFATLGLAAAGALVASDRRLRRLGPPLLALASFFSYALLAVGAWAVLLSLLRDGWRRAAAMALACGAAVVALYLALYLLSGFDLPASLQATNLRYREGIAGIRPYLFWVFGSPAAFLLVLGVPIAWGAARSFSRGEASAVALAVVIGLSAVIGYAKGETERIWLFLVPLACLAAARALRPETLRLSLAVMAVQALAIEALFITIW